ncbi:hypothetical protein [Streptomyces sp. NPDC058739]|uniref:hypothetical protein n=1 Tax=Streptomyces sp. NPDC058739 TaxID=3346618 RepID=UPI003679174A
MGTDIHGFVEYRAQTVWRTGSSLAALGLGRDYDGFVCLFGVRDFGGRWRPVVGQRGLPDDVSDVVRAEHASWGDAAFGATWLGWDEVLGIDWDEPSLPRGAGVSRYRREADGTLRLLHRHDWSRAFGRASGVDTLTTDPGLAGELWDEGAEWDTGGTVFRVERARRRDMVPADGPWGPVWDVMRTLAGSHGDARVRLVVWFDE